MKTYLLFIICLTFLSVSSAQEQHIKAKFKITNAEINSKDYTDYYVANKGYLSFYELDGSEDLYFVSFSLLRKTQSFGKIYDVEAETEVETEKSFKTVLYKFKWSYTNDYDDKTGVAQVSFYEVSKALKTEFICIMTLENHEILKLKGYKL